MPAFLSDKLTTLMLLIFCVLGLALLNVIASDDLLGIRKDFDRAQLQQLFSDLNYDNDVLVDTYLLSPYETQSVLVDLELLNLRRDRLAYIARDGNETVAVAVPATADDGFNGEVDILVSIDMYGRIRAARVIEDVDSNTLYGIVDIIESKWMNSFTGNSMRDILRLSWQPITAENEYDQFVGASITPKSVANKIYDALVFFQSNRIELIGREGATP